MQIVWANLRISDRYVTGDQWGPLVKLFAQDYEIHLHLNLDGSQVNAVGTVTNSGFSRIRLNRYYDDVAVAGKQPLANPTRPPTVEQAQALFLRTAGVATTYHQWLRADHWTLGCGRAQQARMRGHKPPYQP